MKHSGYWHGECRREPPLIARITTCAVVLIFWGNSVTASDAVYMARDYAFTGPDQVVAGWVTVTLDNQGKDLHQLQVVKLPQGKTLDDFTTEIATNHKRLPSWVLRQGGPNGIVPGEQALATVHLDPGDYVVICGIPDGHGIPHVALGMWKALRVLPAPSKNDGRPAADVTITEMDFSFNLSHPISPGTTSVHVANKGTQAHEVVVVQLAPGATATSFLDAFEPGAPVSPAGKPVGGMVGLEPGGEGFFTINFVKGRYGLICFLPDLVRGAPHFTRGMLLDVTVD